MEFCSFQPFRASRRGTPRYLRKHDDKQAELAWFAAAGRSSMNHRAWIRSQGFTSEVTGGLPATVLADLADLRRGHDRRCPVTTGIRLRAGSPSMSPQIAAGLPAVSTGPRRVCRKAPMSRGRLQPGLRRCSQFRPCAVCAPTESHKSAGLRRTSLRSHRPCQHPSRPTPTRQHHGQNSRHRGQPSKASGAACSD